MSNAKNTTFKVGDGATYGFHGDSYPATVRKVSPSGKTVWVSSDNYSVNPGHTTYGQEGPVPTTFTSKNEDKPETWTKFTYRPKSGDFCETGSSFCHLSSGRRYSQNPSF